MQDTAIQTTRDEVATIPLERIDVSRPKLFQDDTVGAYFARLRKEDPVHWCADSPLGSYWSITKYRDIMTVDVNHKVFSSDVSLGGITIRDVPMEHRRPMFIQSDPPKHDEQRKAVSPIVGPANLAQMEGLIRRRTQEVLDSLPRNETFNWVDLVSIELTTRMLATLFDFPFEERRLLTYWSDVTTADITAGGPIDSDEKRMAELQKCYVYFRRLFDERKAQPPRNDLISMLAHNPATRHMGPQEYMGNLVLLIVGGNDTTRNSMSGGLLAMVQHPQEWAKLRANPKLVDSLVPEIIRWQTPIAHMRRTAIRDTELGGKLIRAGDKVAMWYLSANRDSDAIDEPHRFIIDRPRPKKHLAFGFGIHHCVGNRLAELQLRILWEAILERFPVIEVTGTPVRTLSNFVHGFTAMPVTIPARY